MAGSEIGAIPAEPDLPSCSLCMRALGTSSPGRFGLLPTCDHKYCAICLVHWSGQHQTCPRCRTRYEGLIIWPTVDLAMDEKSHVLQNARNFDEDDVVIVGFPVPRQVLNDADGQDNPLQQAQQAHQPIPNGQIQPLALAAAIDPALCAICHIVLVNTDYFRTVSTHSVFV